MIGRRAALFAILVMSAALPLRAQQLELRAGAAGVVGLARNGVFFPSGVEVRAGVRAAVLPIPLLFQLDGAYSRSSGDSATSGVGGLRQQLWSAALSAVLPVPVSARARVRPYVLAGGGVYHRPEIPVLGLAFTSVGLHAGAGADGRLLGVPIFVEARYTDVLLQARNVEYLTLGAGVRFATH